MGAALNFKAQCAEKLTRNFRCPGVCKIRLSRCGGNRDIYLVYVVSILQTHVAVVVCSPPVRNAHYDKDTDEICLLHCIILFQAAWPDPFPDCHLVEGLEIRALGRALNTIFFLMMPTTWQERCWKSLSNLSNYVTSIWFTVCCCHDSIRVIILIGSRNHLPDNLLPGSPHCLVSLPFQALLMAS